MQAHSLTADHRLYMRLDDQNGDVYLLPEDTVIEDDFFKDIRAALHPRYTRDDLEDIAMEECRDAFGKDYVPGFVPINTNGRLTTVAAVIQVLAHVQPLRDHYLVSGTARKPKVEMAWSELIKRMWSQKLLRASITPHAFLHALSADKDTLPGDLFVHILNSLDRAVMVSLFQGTLVRRTHDSDGVIVERIPMPFLVLALDLPPLPLFIEAATARGAAIQQVSLDVLLKKYDGQTRTFMPHPTTFELNRLPPYLLMNVRRQTKGDHREYNNTVVNFGEQLRVPNALMLDAVYELVASVAVHHEMAEDATGLSRPTPAKLTYTAFIKDNGQWWETEDSAVKRVVSVEVARMAETCFLVWRRFC